MQLSKKIPITLIFTFLLVILFSPGCKKYEEGPSISFRSRAERVANNWKMEKVTLNGADITNQFTTINYTESYDKEGNYSFNSSIQSGDGKWAFQNDDLEIRRSGVSGQSSADLIILKLKEKSFWYQIIDGNDIYEFHLIPSE